MDHIIAAIIIAVGGIIAAIITTSRRSHKSEKENIEPININKFTNTPFNRSFSNTNQQFTNQQFVPKSNKSLISTLIYLLTHDAVIFFTVWCTMGYLLMSIINGILGS